MTDSIDEDHCYVFDVFAEMNSRKEEVVLDVIKFRSIVFGFELLHSL